MGMVTEREIARIPATNLRVPREEFARLWLLAQQRSRLMSRQGVTDWYAVGVVVTCRWVARTTVELNGRRFLATRPVGGGDQPAYEELIEEEYLTAETMLARQPPPLKVANRPGFVEAVSATLRWSWRCSGQCPVIAPVTTNAAG